MVVKGSKNSSPPRRQMKVVTKKFATSKNMVSDESSLTHVLPMHWDGGEKIQEMELDEVKVYLTLRELVLARPQLLCCGAHRLWRCSRDGIGDDLGVVWATSRSCDSPK